MTAGAAPTAVAGRTTDDAVPGAALAAAPPIVPPSGLLHRYWLAALCVAVAVLGIFLRVWILGNSPMNSDEATTGLVAHEILRGHLSALTWGQAFGGVEAYVVAFGFLLFGQSPFVLDATPAVLALVASVLVWRIGRRLLAPGAGLAAAVLSWIWCESSLWNSTRETGYHEVQMVLALGFLLQAVRIVQRLRVGVTDRIADWLVLGLVGGVGVWASPEVVETILPALALLVVNVRGRPVRWIGARVATATAAALVGTSPWIWTSLHPTARTAILAPESYPGRLRTFVVHVAPMLLGLRVEGAGAWEGGRVVGPLACLVLVALVVACSVALVRGGGDAWVLVLAVATYPVLYAAFPTAWFWNDGRYGLSLTPLLALVLVGGLWRVLRPTAAAAASGALLVLACLSTVLAFNDGFGVLSSPARLGSFAADPNTSVRALAAGLVAAHVTQAYAGYWVAGDLTFVSDGRVDARSLTEASRNLPVARRTPSGRTAWIFVPPSSVPTLQGQLGTAVGLDPGTVTAPGLTDWLDRHHIPYEVRPIAGFEVVVPARTVGPTALDAPVTET